MISHGRRYALPALVAFVALAVAGCMPLLPSQGGGQTAFEGPRHVDPADVALPDGYRIEVVADGLTFPTGLAFDDRGRPHVLESGYAYGEVITTPRLSRLEPDGSRTLVARGDDPPWNGVAHHDGAFFVAGGTFEGGSVLRIGEDGEITTLLRDLPSLGDHHTNGPAIGPDGRVYVGQGTATNAGVVGPDNADFGWLHRHPDFHDVPCRDVTLAGVNHAAGNPLRPEGGRTVTGAFLPFDTPSRPGQVIRGELPCTGAILSVDARGGEPELVAWGLRNPFGLAWSPGGELYVLENSYDERGSRPVFGTGDPLWRIEPGTWYGWPDFHAGLPLTDGDRFAPPGGRTPGFLLAEHPNPPPAPAAVLGVHSSSNGLDFAGASFGHEGQAFVAQFGDMAPGVGKVLAPVGFRIVRVDPTTGVVHDFAVNTDPTGPASRVGGGGLERPVSVRFSPDGTELWVVDFGVMTTTDAGPLPWPETGVVWRIVREDEP